MSGVPVMRLSPVFPLGAIALLLLAPARLLPAASPEEPGAFAPPRHCAPPGKRHAVTNRAFTGIPSVAVAPQGRLWATWYAGVTPGEDLNNYAVLATSGDGLIRVVYDYNRRGDREILMATFREDDVTAGRPTSDEVLLRQLVSKGSGGVVRPKRATPAATRKGPSDGTAPAVQTSDGGAYRVRRKSHTLARTAPFLSLP